MSTVLRGRRGQGAARFILLAIGLLALVVFFSVPGGAAQAKSWRIQNMDVTLDVQKNGDVVVDEHVTFSFAGNYHFVSRAIPTANMDGIDDIEVRDATGQVLPRGEGPGTWSTSTEGDTRYITVNFDLTDTAYTWTFHYRAKGVVMFFDQGDELRWYVFDAETPVTIEAVKATVKLPGEVPAEKMTQAVESGYGVQTRVSSPGPSTMVYEATDVPPYTKFWIVTGFPKGVVQFTWTPRRIAAFIVPKAGFVLPIAAFLVMLLLWRRRGRDDPAAVYAKYVSEPPSTLAPGIVGALIDEKVDVKEIIATIVDLARRGYLEIIDTKKKGLLSKPESVFKRTKPLDDLQGFEKQVAEALFDARHPDEVTTEELKDHFYTHVDPLVNSIYSATIKAGLFHGNPAKVRRRWFGWGLLIAVILGGITAIMAVTKVPGWGWWLAGSAVAVIIVWCFAPHMPQRTTKGAQEQRKWEAFRNYLRDLTRFQDMEAAQETFEKYLPYAIALGVEKEWVRRFEGLSVPPPPWYRPLYLPMPSQHRPMGSGVPAGGGNIGQSFSLDSISDGLFASLSNMSSVLTSAPSSSGSGRGAFGGSHGGFGGGFSGGSGGGGFRAG